MPIPTTILTEAGRAPMDAAYLRARLAQATFPDDEVVPAHDYLQALGIPDAEGAAALLSHGPGLELNWGARKAWFLARGWLND